MAVSSDSFSELPNTKPLAVSFRFLLSLYGIVPVCLCVVLLDKWFFNQALRESLPNSPSHFLLFQLLFGTPHIIASSLLILSHKEYLTVFKHKLLAMTAFIALFFGVGSLFISYKVLYVITACWTVYHVLKQQHGIVKGLCKLPVWAFRCQVSFSVLAGIFIYLGIFLQNALAESGYSELVWWLASGFTACLVLSSFSFQRFIDNQMGFWFLWANTLLVVCSWFVYGQEYYFLAILMPRLVHDITAYSFYVSHDYNRSQTQNALGIYRFAGLLHLPVVVVLPLTSVLLTYLLQAYGDDLVNLMLETVFSTHVYKAITLGLFGYLALMHYYTEAFVWSAGSPLRRYILFKL